MITPMTSRLHSTYLILTSIFQAFSFPLPGVWNLKSVCILRLHPSTRGPDICIPFQSISCTFATLSEVIASARPYLIGSMMILNFGILARDTMMTPPSSVSLGFHQTCIRIRIPVIGQPGLWHHWTRSVPFWWWRTTAQITQIYYWASWWVPCYSQYEEGRSVWPDLLL